MKKNFFLFFSIMTALSLAVGCSSSSNGSEGSNGGKVELTFWPAANPQEVEFAEEVVQEFNESNDRIHVSMEPLPASQSTEEVLLASIAAGTTPDIVANIYPGAVSQFVEAGGLYEINKIDGALDYIKKRTPSETVEAFTSDDGKLYQIPWKGNPTMIVYNKKHFEEAGLTEEDMSTYSGFIEGAKKLTRDTDGDGKNDIWSITPNIEQTWWQRFFDFYPLYINATRGDTLLKDGQPAFNNKRAEEVINFYNTLFQENIVPNSTFKQNLLVAEKVSMSITGPWVLADLKEQAPDTEFGVMPVPAPDDLAGEQVFTYGDPKNIGIFNTTEHPEESWEFVKYYMNEKNDALFLKTTNQIPFRKGIESADALEDFYKENPLISEFAKQAPYTRAVDNHPKLIDIYGELSLEYQKAAVMDKISAEEALNKAEEEVKEIVED